jgi:acyl-coenzyme A thioesterase PaaI-like protein
LAVSPGSNRLSSPEERVVTLWRKYGKSALGRRFYSYLFGRLVPYTGTVRPIIEEIEPGHARVRMRERRRLRNHLRSIHAIALANIGELASGLAMIAALPDKTRAIVTNLEIDYIKKARGTLEAVGEAQPPETVTDPVTIPAYAVIRNRDGERVASVTVHWLLSPRE